MEHARRPYPEIPPPVQPGLILPARISQTVRDHCELDLLDPETGSVLARGRLYQSDSCAQHDVRLLADIDEYRKGTILSSVFVHRLRHEQGRPLWFVHERWAVNNPWPDLALHEDDIITGCVKREVFIADRNDPVGYLIQLDTQAAISSIAPRSARTEVAERRQPDIEVYLPVEELPWADGHLAELATEARKQQGRLRLEKGDPVQAVVLAIQLPPDNPVISIRRLINHIDAYSHRDFYQREVLALWRFRQYWRGTEQAAELAEVDSLSAAAAAELKEQAQTLPYRGKRLLLVDDDAEALKAQAELLKLMGAEVRYCIVVPNQLGVAINTVVNTLRDWPADLVLVDNNLPGRDLGPSLIEQAKAKLASAAIRFALLTANAVNGMDEAARQQLAAKGVGGLLQRPLEHAGLQQLLAGQAIWQVKDTAAMSSVPASAAGTIPVLANPTARSLPLVLETLRQTSRAQFVMLIKAQRHLGSQDVIAAGEPPFTRHDYPTVLANSDLHLLLEARTNDLTIGAEGGGNESLRSRRGGSAYWQRLALTQDDVWLLGMGGVSDSMMKAQWPLWSLLVTTALAAQGWQQATHHLSGFVQLGLAHQGLSHEIFNWQGELSDQLSNLKKRLERLAVDSPVSRETQSDLLRRVASITQLNADLLAFAQRQLRDQAFRQRQVFLPEAVESITRIVKTECQEAEVALHVATSPSLALPMPYLVLVLPVVNLLINAAKHHYRAENRRVELLFGLESAGATPWLVVDVRDNGPGLTPATLARLWQAGYSSARDADQRHGIGMWLSRQLVVEAGGTLTLHQNWRGLGAWFRLRYPIHLG